MKFIDLLKFVGLVVDLEKKTVLTANIDSTDLGTLAKRIGIIIEVFEVEDCKDSVSGVVTQDYGRTRKMLIFDSPESDVFFTARHQFISLNRTELDSQYVEITDLFSDQLRFSLNLDSADIEKKYSLSFILIESNHN